MSLPRGTIEGQPTLTIVDLLEKHKGTGAFQFSTLADAIRYVSRTMGETDLSVSDLEALADYMARDGAAWVKGVNFYSKKIRTMIKEMELTARPPRGSGGAPFGVLVISTSKSFLSKTKQMRKLKVAGLRTLRYLNVDKNRAFLAIHDDTDHLHLHIVYNRYDSFGRLTEREPGKFRRYLMEDICARVAFDIGYNVESGARTVPLQTGELIDLTSGQVIRTLDFEPVMDGCKARNSERRKARTGHALEDIALEACRNINDLELFRSRLAFSGIRYVRAGTGAVFIDASGRKHRASKVNYCLSRGRLFEGHFKNDLPDESNFVLQLAERGRKIQGVATPAAGSDAPTYTITSGLTPDQMAEANRRLLRGYSDVRCGRPRKVDMGDNWPKGFPWGGLKLPNEYLEDLRSGGIEIKNRGCHAELWREQRMIAVHREDQIVVYTRDKEDLRILLLAANQEWGSLKLTGSTAFKNQMADLAVELNILVTNPELQRRIKAQQQKLAVIRSAEMQTFIAQNARASGLTACGTAGEQSKLDCARSNARPSPEAKTASAEKTGAGVQLDKPGQQSKLDVESGRPPSPITAKAPDITVNPAHKAVSKTASNPIPPSLAAAKAGLIAGSTGLQSAVPKPVTPTAKEIDALLRDLRTSDQFVERVSADRHRLMHTANYRRMMEPRIDDPRVQTGLAEIYGIQHADLDRLEAFFREVGVSIRLIQDVSPRQEHTYQPAGLQGDATELYRRYQYHPRCKEILRAEHDRRESIRQALKEQPPRIDESAKALSLPTGTSEVAPAEGQTHDGTATNANRTAPPSVSREQSKPRQGEANSSSIVAPTEGQDQQSQSGSEEVRMERTNVHPDLARCDQKQQPSRNNTTEASSVADPAMHNRGATPDLPHSTDDHRRPGSPELPSQKNSLAAGEPSARDQIGSPAYSHAPKSGAAQSEPDAVAAVLAKQLQPDWEPQESPHYTALLFGLPAKLGREWPLFQENWRRHAATPGGQDKDRLAFVINRDLQISVADRLSYPQLRELFAASDRNLEDLQQQQQDAEIRRHQGGW